MSWLRGGLWPRRRALFVVADVLIIIVANLLANLLRFDDPFPSGRVQFLYFHRWMYLDLVLTPLIFWVFRLYRSSWRYTSIHELIQIVQAVLARTVAVVLAFVALGYHGLPRSVVVMDTVLLLLLAGGLRTMGRVHGELSRKRSGGRRVLIVGAGESGEMIVRQMRQRGDLDYVPIGFVDDDPEKHGVNIHGVPVLGGRDDIPEILRTRRAVEVIVAIPSASARDLREIRRLCGDRKVRLKALPSMPDFLEDPASMRQIRDVQVEDLLGREPVVLDVEAIRRDIYGHTVLVTGGGGSIGREMARQLAALRPSHLVLVDRSENNLFAIQMDLRSLAPDLPVSYCVGDIQDEVRMHEVFEKHRPHVVYHAAAYKHVPMMESNVVEAVSNNVFGTRLLARLAAEFEAVRFVLISTDKAVNPSSVMGRTKRVAELILQSMNGASTRFIAVRFGNVLGSDGSVVPIFRNQIASGGPVTVTHPEATRYFMTIPEAVQLVMQAGSMGEGGEIFMLDMGEPVRIVDLARNMIELSGFRTDVDIDIQFTGLRPGEKLHEELSAADENTLPTAHEKIVKLSVRSVAHVELNRELEGLRTALGRRDGETLGRELAALVLAYGTHEARGSTRPRAVQTHLREVSPPG
ncbi:MAG: nucleoside-diphosphate sugar epimerase/dehydratase [Acidobacteriota bacterium]